MFDPGSRYYHVENAELETPDGEKAAYKRRRILPQGREMRELTRITVTEGDRLDLITARTLGQAEQFWRVADANDAMNPPELTAEIGRILRVPVPEA